MNVVLHDSAANITDSPLPSDVNVEVGLLRLRLPVANLPS